MSQLAEILTRSDFSIRPYKNTKAVTGAFGTSDGAAAVEPYTVPAGRKALWAAYAWNNPGASGTLKTSVKRADGTRRAVQQQTMASAAASAASQPVILAAGESPSFDTLTLAGVICGARSVMEFDDDGTVLRVDVDVSAGDNLLYTVPAGKLAVVFSSSLQLLITTSPTLTVGNFAGATRALTVHVLPAGTGASSSATRWGSTVSVSNNGAGFPTCARPVLNEGEKLIVNSDGGGPNLWAFANILLLDK